MKLVGGSQRIDVSKYPGIMPGIQVCNRNFYCDRNAFVSMEVIKGHISLSKEVFKRIVSRSWPKYHAHNKLHWVRSLSTRFDAGFTEIYQSPQPAIHGNDSEILVKLAVTSFNAIKMRLCKVEKCSVVRHLECDATRHQGRFKRFLKDTHELNPVNGADAAGQFEAKVNSRIGRRRISHPLARSTS